MASVSESQRVVIVGGGPAGASVAISLTNRGLTPVVLETRQGPEFKVGECLPPSAGPILQQLGLREQLQRDGHLPSYGNRSAWGTPKLIERDFIFGTQGDGWQLDRARYGLIVDYLHQLELIHVNTAGKVELKTLSRDSQDEDEQDMFWAHLGGGGGNFGIVTKYWFQDPPAAPSWADLTSVAWEWDEISRQVFTELVTNYGNFFAHNSAPDSPYKDLFALLHLTQKAAGQIVLTVQSVSDQSPLLDDFINAVEPKGVTRVRQRVPVGFHHVVLNTTQTRRMPWLEATQTLNGTGPNQRGKYKSAYMLKPFPEQQIEVMWKYLTDPAFQNSQALLQVDSYGCEINRIAPADTAIPQRSSIMKLQYQTYWTEEAEDATNLNWIRNFYDAMYGPLGPYPDETFDGCYVNYPDVDLNNWQYLYYKENYPRLQQAKAKCDPLNVFNHLQSIDLPSDEPV